MNSSHVHLALNHFPIIGLLLGSLFSIFYLLLKNKTLLQTALFTFIITGLVTIPTFTSGEGSEEMIEHIPNIEESRIEKHEELAKQSLVLIEVIAATALIAFLVYYRKKRIHNALFISILILSIGTSVLLLFVNNSGGEIRHSEIRKDQGNNLPSNDKKKLKDENLALSSIG